MIIARKAMVFTGSKMLRDRVVELMKNYDVTLFLPKNMHDVYGYLYEHYIDFVIIDVDFGNNKGCKYPGFDFAETVRKKIGYIRKPIIFIASDENSKLYAYENYNCIDYILKPIDAHPFLNAVNKALIFSEIAYMKTPKVVKSGNTYKTIYLEDVMFIDVIGRNVYFHMADGEIIEINNAHLHTFREEACRRGFICIRRDTIVNTQYIDKINMRKKIIGLKCHEADLYIGDTYRDKVEEYIERNLFT